MLKKPRITLIARADNTGLGVQTWEFYRHMKPDRVFVIDLTDINASMGKKTDLHLDRFPGAEVVKGFPDTTTAFRMCEDTDLIFTVEIPYGYQLFTIARSKGVKTVLQYNFEFLDYLRDSTLPHPDLFMAPSPWRLNDAMHVVGDDHITYLPVPTDRQRFPFKRREKAEHFLHIAGHPAHEDRNGTWDVLHAMEHVKNRIRLTIKTQSKDFFEELSQWCFDREVDNVAISIDGNEAKNYWENFGDQYDVLLLPRKYGGLSLQRNEAMSLGMPVVMTDQLPNSLTLPTNLLVPVHHQKDTMTRTKIEVWQADPQALAAKIDELYENPGLVAAMSDLMNQIAEQESWDTMQPKYEAEFAKLCQA